MKQLIMPLLLLLFVILPMSAYSQDKEIDRNDSVRIARIEKDLPIGDLDNGAWKRAAAVHIDRYWDGSAAPADRQFLARLLWTDSFLYVRFEARQGEPLVISENPQFDKKTMNLWDRDVCEIFLAADKAEPRKYLEFEVAPTGEWIDVGIDLTSGERISDWELSSGMEAASRIGKDKIVMAIKIPWRAFGKTPKAGDVWLGNLLRCVGKDPGRGYLTWRPTMTKEPSFHVPEKFGKFVFGS